MRPSSSPPLIQRALPYSEESAQLFEQVRSYPYPIFLDSNTQNQTSKTDQATQGRYDVIAADPSARAIIKDNRLHTAFLNPIHPNDKALSISNPFNHEQTPFSGILAFYHTWAARYHWPLDHHGQSEQSRQFSGLPPFTPGLFGYFGYEAKQAPKEMPLKQDEINIPETCVGFYPWIIVVDHHLKQTFWLSIDPDLTPDRYLKERHTDLKPYTHSGSWQSNMTFRQYAQKFETIQAHIQAGDCYQVNLAQRFHTNVTGDPWEAYTRLRLANPAPFAAYFSTPFGTVMSLSPERFIHVDQGKATTKPIKGTAARHACADKDNRARAQLAKSSKDRAENLMITDLLRNDFGKICEIGSVTTTKLFSIESYTNVHHMVSTVSAKIPETTHPMTLLDACFPGGSITGAPKIKAMQIIHSLEPSRRHIYCGSIAHIGLTGNLTSSITIRTLLHTHNDLYCWAGGGIVADSTCKAEYQETLDKVNLLLRTIGAL